MKIQLEQLDESPAPFAFEADTEWWRRFMPASPNLPVDLAAPLSVAGSAYLMGDDVYLEGSLTGELPLECGRCLARYGHRLQEPFRLVLEPAGVRVPADPEAARALARDGFCLEDDVEAGCYRGPEIDLGAFLHEVVATALPVQPLCRDDCAGLCTRCGADRNRDTCECSEVKPESPFAVLSALRKELTEGDS